MYCIFLYFSYILNDLILLLFHAGSYICTQLFGHGAYLNIGILLGSDNIPQFKKCSCFIRVQKCTLIQKIPIWSTTRSKLLHNTEILFSSINKWGKYAIEQSGCLANPPSDSKMSNLVIFQRCSLYDFQHYMV